MRTKSIVLLVLWGVLIGCTINDSEFQIKGIQSNPTLVAPLASGDLSILDILKKKDSSRIKVTSDGLVYLDYDTTLITQDVRNLVDIPDIGTTSYSLAVPPGSYPANQNDYTSTTSSKTVDMGISPEKLTEIAFKSGTLSYNMNLSPPNNKFKYAAQISIPEFIDNTTNQGFSQEVTNSGTIDLSAYTFKSATANKFTLKVTLVIKKNNQSATVNNNTNLNVNISFAGMDFTYIKGFFGDQVANPSDQSIQVQAFGTSFQNGASVSFANPTIDLNVINDYGVPLKVTFAALEARKQGAAMTMQTNPASPIAINQPASLGTSATTDVAVTNVKQVIDFSPTSFYYKVSGHINAGLSSGSNFMADTSKMRVRMHVQIPLWGQASNIFLSDTLDADLTDVDQVNIDSAWLKVYVVNELPLDARLQFVLLDSGYKFIDSLLTTSQTGIIKGSIVDTNGDLQTPQKVDKLTPLQTDKANKLFRTKKIVVSAKLNTSKNSNGIPVDVKFKTQYRINVKLGLRTKAKLKVNF